MPPTLKDIADRAGVSVSTVSRVINNDETRRASPGTAERVWKIIHEMRYEPNEAARTLIHGAKKSVSAPRRAIGCILSGVSNVFGDPFFSEAIAGVHEEAARRGYVMEYTLPVAAEKGLRDAALFNNLVSRPVDGAVLLGRFPRALLDMLKSRIPRLVYCGLNALEEDMPQVVCDAARGMEAALSYLCALGHTRVGYIGQTNRDCSLSNERRFFAFEAAMRARALPILEKDVVDTELTLSGCHQAAARALDAGDHATAYLCANDITAIAALRALHEKGLKVPGDVSLIGFDDIELCRYVSPALTTLHTDIKSMGVLGARVLIDGVVSPAPPAVTSLPFRLVERESCARIVPPAGDERR